MKIFYSAGNRRGSNTQLLRFLQNCSDRFEIKIAAFYHNSQDIKNIDWTLDAIYRKISDSTLSKKFFNYKYGLNIDLKLTKTLLNDIIDFAPDLIISDCETISGLIANLLKIPLWYCSPLLLITGVKLEKKKFVYYPLLEVTKKFTLKRLPAADKYLIYSVFGDVKFRPQLKPGFEWVTPYYIKADESQKEKIVILDNKNRNNELYNIIKYLKYSVNIFDRDKEKSNYLVNSDSYKEKLKKSDWILTTGETSYMADAFYNKKGLTIFPSLDDFEEIINACYINLYNIGKDLGQVEFMENYALEEIEKSLKFKRKDDYLSIQPDSFLHNKIEEICI